jgi:hypothetical protein
VGDAVELAVQRALAIEQVVIGLQAEKEALGHPEIARQS